jgi:hypothetical protein
MSRSTKKPRRRIAGEKRRVNLKIEEDLAEWAFEYAERQGTTVTSLIAEFLRMTRAVEEASLAKDAEQI